jgi:hypothetical protein
VELEQRTAAGAAWSWSAATDGAVKRARQGRRPAERRGAGAANCSWSGELERRAGAANQARDDANDQVSTRYNNKPSRQVRNEVATERSDNIRTTNQNQRSAEQVRKEVAKCRTGEQKKGGEVEAGRVHRWRGGLEERISELARLERQMAKAMPL